MTNSNNKEEVKAVRATRASSIADTSEVEKLRLQVGLLLNHCDKEGGECSYCSTVICPHKDPLHFHHDGCPSCTCDEEEEYSKIADPYKDMWEVSQKHIESLVSKLECAERFMKRAREFQDGSVDLGRWSSLMMDLAAYSAYPSPVKQEVATAEEIVDRMGEPEPKDGEASAEKIYQVVMDDLDRRSGFDNWYHEISDAVKSEIKEELTAKIRSAMEKQKGGV